MKVILKSDVRDLGHSGDLVEVRPGYARNYLLPGKLAVPATEGNLKDYQKRIAAAKERETRERAAANEVADRIRGQRVVIIHRAAEGTQRLHGSVTSAEISGYVSKLAGREIDRRDIDLKTPIRSLGEYQVSVKLMRGLTVPVRVLVAETEPVEEPPVQETPAPEVAEALESSEDAEDAAV